MNPYCFIQCIGQRKAPDDDKWQKNVGKGTGTNRLVYVIDGEGGYILRDKKYTFKKNHLYLIPAYNDIPTWSSYESEERRLDHSFINFEMIPPIISAEVIEIDPHSDPIMSATFSVFSEIAHSNECRIKNIKKDELDYTKATVMYIVNKMISKHNIELLDDEILVAALKEMHKGIATDISIKDLAKKAFMSYDGFIRRFQKALGVTPYAYLKQLRIRTAIALRNEGVTLEKAAEKCGYSDSVALLHALSGENISFK